MRQFSIERPVEVQALVGGERSLYYIMTPLSNAMLIFGFLISVLRISNQIFYKIFNIYSFLLYSWG